MCDPWDLRPWRASSLAGAAVHSELLALVAASSPAGCNPILSGERPYDQRQRLPRELRGQQERTHLLFYDLVVRAKPHQVALRRDDEKVCIRNVVCRIGGVRRIL